MTGFIHSSLLEQNSPSTSTMRMEIRGTASFFHSPRAGIEFQGQQSSSSASAIFPRSTGKALVHRPLFRRYLIRDEKKKTSGRSTRRPIFLGQRSRATSNVRSRFLFHSFLPRSLTLLPRVSSSSLPFLSSPRQFVHTGQIARIRLHRTVK